MLERGLLGDVGPDRHRRGIPVADLHIDVVQPGKQRALGAVHGRLVRLGAVVGEVEQVFAVTALVTGGVLGQQEDRSVLTVADQTDAAVHADRLAEAVSALGNEHDAVARLGVHPVDGLLQGRSVIADPSAKTGKSPLTR